MMKRNVRKKKTLFIGQKIRKKDSQFIFHPRLNPRYSSGVSSPGRHVRTRLYFTSESHIHSLLTVLTHGGLVDVGIELNIQLIFNIFT